MDSRDDKTISSEIRSRTENAIKDRKPIPIEFLKYIDTERYYADKEKRRMLSEQRIISRTT